MIEGQKTLSTKDTKGTKKDITLMHGDCLELMPQIPDGSINLILADPPYGTTACKWDSVIDVHKMWHQLKLVGKINAAYILFGSEPFSSLLRTSNLKSFRHDWIWQKNRGANFACLSYQPSKVHEIISVFYKKKPTYNPIRISRSKLSLKRNPAGVVYTKNCPNLYVMSVTGLKRKVSKPTPLDGKKNPISIIQIDTEQKYHKKFKHPTQKPVALMEYLIKTYTNPGDTVLDFCMGSGTTGVACKNLGRKFIGIEKDKDYFDIASQRIAETPFASAQGPTL